jgi:hypothetical protein
MLSRAQAQAPANDCWIAKSHSSQLALPARSGKRCGKYIDDLNQGRGTAGHLNDKVLFGKVLLAELSGA